MNTLIGYLNITNRYVFFGIAALLFAYVAYIMIRKRKGLRAGGQAADSEI